MLKNNKRRQINSLFDGKPRKMLKIDLINNTEYNQFQGNSQIDINQLHQNTQMKSEQREQKIYDGMKDNKYMSQIQRKIKYTYEKQVSENQKLFQMIAGQNVKFKKVGAGESIKKNLNQINIKKQGNNIKTQTQLIQQNMPKVKLEQNCEIIEEIKKQQKKIQKININVNGNGNKQSKNKQAKLAPSSNWSKFLQQSASNKSLTKNNPTNSTKTVQNSKFIAIDCQFVRCGQVQTLARVSIVSQNCQTLYDSYIKPQEKITDYLTSITGITYSHIKNAPFWKDQVKKVKKIMLNKILIGHTIHKDLQVMKLTTWAGVSKPIDIAEFSAYKQKNGSKLTSLKRLTTTLLQRNIQSGWHSSVQDAVATMDLFKLNKKKILKENNLI